MDQTLLDVDIIKEVRENKLLDPFDEEGVKGASYDIRAGKKAIVAWPEGYEDIKLDVQGKLVVPPGRACVVYSLEKVQMPLDMKGRLSLRSHFAIKGLSYAGGVIDPGYQGYLFFTLVNLANSEVEIEYGEPLVTAEFIQLSKPAREPYQPGEGITDVPPEKMPSLPPRQVYDMLELSAGLDELREIAKTQAYRDQTLRDVDLRTMGNKLIEPFSEDCVKGASYDIRVGAKAILACPPTGERPSPVGGHVPIALDGEVKKSFDIPPLHSCTIYSLEKVQMPLDMKGRLSIRSKFAVQRLNYDGGIIDPGYNGHLFFTVANLGDTPVTIKYGERLITAEFVRLPQPAEKSFCAEGELITEVDPAHLPPLPGRMWYDLVELSKKVDELDEAVKAYEPTQRIMDLVFLAGLAGIVAGFATVFLPRLPALSAPAVALIIGAVIALGILGGFILGRRRRTWMP